VKKAILILEVVFIMFVLSSCTLLRTIVLDEYAESDKVAQLAVTAIEDKDEQALIGLFSKRALDDSDDLEEGMKYSFDLYEGDCLEIERSYCIVASHYGYPGNGKWTDTRYKVTTTEGAYWLYFEYVLIDGSHSDAEGIYSLWLYEDETTQKDVDALSEEHSDKTGLPYHAGIYHPGWDGKYERGWQNPGPWKD